LALISLGVKAGDEVLLPANAYPTVFAVAAGGLVPKLVDIDPVTYNINPVKIENSISKKQRQSSPSIFTVIRQIWRRY
jgi:dTDP-4-amino-4,6-dideoxygalactose transaminase